MNSTKVVALASLVAIASFMIAAATVIPGHDAQAKVRVGNTRSTAIQAANNGAHQAAGAGAQGNIFSSTVTNTQTQVNNAGSTGTG